MIERLGQTSATFFKRIELKKEVSKAQSVATKADTYIPSTSKSNLWNYSLKEVKSPIRNYTSFRFGNEPDWSKIPTKGMRTLSYEQIFNEMKNLAQRKVIALQAEVRDSKWQSEWDDIMRTYVYLQRQYISDVSPDRKALYEQAKKTIRKMEEENKIHYPVTFTLVDFLCDLDDLESLANSYGTLETAYATGYGTEYIINIGGEQVMSTIRGEWVANSTVAEQMRMDEYNNLFDKLYEQYKMEFLSAQKSLEK